MMQKIVCKCERLYNVHKKETVGIMALFDLILIFYFALLIPGISNFSFIQTNADLWYKMYNVINPFTFGSYIVGIIVVLHFLFFRNILLRVIYSLFYAVVVFTSIVIIMGMTNLWELALFIPHILVICACGFVVKYQKVAI